MWFLSLCVYFELGVKWHLLQSLCCRMLNDGFTLFCTCVSHVWCCTHPIFLHSHHVAVHVHDVIVCAAYLFCNADTLLSYCCEVWAFCALTPVVSNLCLILRGACVSAGCLCSPARRRERRVWYASLTSFSTHHQSALSFLGFLSSTHSLQPIHAHLLWQENQSKCFATDSICDQQLIINLIWSTHLIQASLCLFPSCNLCGSVEDLKDSQFRFHSTLSDQCTVNSISRNAFTGLMKCNEEEQNCLSQCSLSHWKSYTLLYVPYLAFVSSG